MSLNGFMAGMEIVVLFQIININSNSLSTSASIDHILLLTSDDLYYQLIDCQRLVQFAN